MTSEQLFHQRMLGEGAGHPDILEHLCTLRLLARHCWHITEFGVRTGNSTIAFLAGMPRNAKLVSYDINQPQFTPPEDAVGRWTFTQADTGNLPTLQDTDMLFIDTLHTYDHVKRELRHANKVRQWLVFHDTVLFGTNGENNQPGINAAIREFQAANPDWLTYADCKHNNGLLILEHR